MAQAATLLERPVEQEIANRPVVRASVPAATAVLPDGGIPIPELSQLAATNQIVPFKQRTTPDITALNVPAAISVMPEGVPLQRDIETVLREQIAEQRSKEQQQPAPQIEIDVFADKKLPVEGFWMKKILNEKHRGDPDRVAQKFEEAKENLRAERMGNAIPVMTTVDSNVADQFKKQIGATQAEKQAARAEQEQLAEAVR